ncbi:probable LRR receptor-like serine/threonine-protein kinase At2g24230 isoform X2 [Salvia splendens]|uniref:probable LRR receptor-like serine/threonine-protein kinase At2g24230 isoform X2 n=1 Tax=Salvia splendens TaxID=180675 RepID=UPI001C256672|nr:probable LRR receptor-like serine/threonine-protein kinase At2g24230 isoform X2 [Salvia splendens]
MGLGYYGSLMLLALLFRPFVCQEPNPDESFVLEFFHKMSPSRNFSGLFCSWRGVICDSHGGNVVKLEVSGFGLSGAIPDSTIGKLTKLESLDLSNNYITALPNDFWDLGSLKNLNLSHNQISGLLPSNIGNFGQLQSLDLSFNKLSGSIPEAVSSLPTLQSLNLSLNMLESRIPLGILQCHSLVSIDLSENKLNGSLPTGFGAALPQLRFLNLAGNSVLGRDLDFAGMKSIKVLNISDNMFKGSVVGVFVGSLEVVDLSRNQFQGHIAQFSSEILQSAFIGSVNSCPIAANPAFFKRDSPKHRGLKLEVALTLSMVLVLVGLLFLAFGCRSKTSMWTAKQSSSKEELTISGPFSFHTDSTTWVADVKQATTVPVVIFQKPLLNFTFADLLSATSHFDRDTLLAEGRFGPVYRGVLLGGIHVAVKVLVHGSTMTDEEAARELEYLGRIKHPNLVPLTGYCLAGEQRIAIYDYMENGNLHNLLYDLPLGVQVTEDWSTDTWEDENHGIRNAGSGGLLTSWGFRHKIALGTARALAFLHHGCSPPIIHRDVKASSVYLDFELEPRLSDFGLAKIFGDGLDDEVARGSPGYVPPEFLQPESGSPKAPTPKSDVYGFGVILFELITGKKPVGDEYSDEKEENLVTWVRGLVRRSQGLRAIDPNIRGTGPDKQIVEALKIGYLCTADAPSKRPSMHQVVGLLKDLEPVTQE